MSDRTQNVSTLDSDKAIPRPPSSPVPGSPAQDTPKRYGAVVNNSNGDKGPRMTVAVVRDWALLGEYVEDWEALAQNAIEPNLFYEHWFLIPAIKAFASGLDVRIVFIFGTNPDRPTGPPILCGMFPLEHSTRCVGLPASTLSFWKHAQCFLCTPLIRKSLARETLEAFFTYLASEDADCSLVRLNFISGDGPLHHVLSSLLYERSTPVYVFESYSRALIRRTLDAETYLNATISGRHRKELRRKEKRLAERGPLSLTELNADTGAQPWIESFLALESSGWKGKEGSALTVKESERTFFREVASEAYRRGRLMMLAVNLGDQPIAQKCNFLAADGGFAFKIAYDESYSDYSPGVLLEIENIRQLHANPKINWMDSCAAPLHFMINRLWTERRTIQTIIIPTKEGWGEFLVSVMPLLRWLKRRLRVGNVTGAPE
jgi:hypothetical protein